MLGWMAATVGLTKDGLPDEWAMGIFFLGPMVVVVAPTLMRWMRSSTSRQRARKDIDWSVVAMASSAAVVGFFAVLWWPWSLPTAAPQAQQLPLVASASEASFSCRVTNVHDGDTLRCSDGTRLRLHAVAAREIDETCSEGHPCPTASAAAARLELVKLAENRTLACHRTGKSYNRVTAICDNDEGVEINCAMVRSGTTLVWDRFHQQQPICARG
ncbi:nuclease [Brevundimonas diminuta]|uniref:thermonuclease family protein n=1 Tax=Brevundimonas diminuta TaxID=293 RepID=UPI0019034B25|nr:nuclease [Brevundimonas diminuta]MBK1970941.1 nuclease [Brevundimonas diminuta]